MPSSAVQITPQTQERRLGQTIENELHREADQKKPIWEIARRKRCACRSLQRQAVLDPAPDVRLHVLRRHQLNVMPERDQLARPEVGCRTRLNAEHTSGQLGEELQHPPTRQTLANNRCVISIHSVHLDTFFAISRPIVVTFPIVALLRLSAGHPAGGLESRPRHHNLPFRFVNDSPASDGRSGELNSILVGHIDGVFSR